MTIEEGMMDKEYWKGFEQGRQQVIKEFEKKIDDLKQEAEDNKKLSKEHKWAMMVFAYELKQSLKGEEKQDE